MLVPIAIGLTLMVVLVATVWFLPKPPPAVSDDRCVSCHSDDVERLFEGAYRCRACGYEGGSRAGDVFMEEKRAALKAGPPKARYDRAIDELASARRVIREVIGVLAEVPENIRSAGGALLLEALNGGGRYVEEREEQLRALTEAMAESIEAQHWLQNAESLLHDHPDDQVREGITRVVKLWPTLNTDKAEDAAAFQTIADALEAQALGITELLRPLAPVLARE